MNLTYNDFTLLKDFLELMEDMCRQIPYYKDNKFLSKDEFFYYDLIKRIEEELELMRESFRRNRFYAENDYKFLNYHDFINIIYCLREHIDCSDKVDKVYNLAILKDIEQRMRKELKLLETEFA